MRVDFRGFEPFDPVKDKRWLRMRSSGNASASGIEVRAEGWINEKIESLLPPKTMGQIFGVTFRQGADETNQSPLGARGIVCRESIPFWELVRKISQQRDVVHNFFVLMKNASNLYYPSVSVFDIHSLH